MKILYLCVLFCFCSTLYSNEAEIGKIFTNNAKTDVSEQIVRDFLLAAENGKDITPYADNNARISTLNDLKQTHYARHAEVSKNLTVRIRALHSALDSIKIEIKDIIQEGNRVFAYYTISGIQKGIFLGIAPTEKPVFIRVMALFSIEDGKIDAITEMWNEYSVMKQLSHFLL